MKIKYSGIIPFKGYVAINLFGTLFVRKEYKEKIERGGTWYDLLITHESIHTEQMKETFYIGFYILYFIFWIIRLITPPMDTAYKDISFEQEAYSNQRDSAYLNVRKPYNWINYMFTSFRKSSKKWS